jgi:hypothetical protein
VHLQERDTAVLDRETRRERERDRERDAKRRSSRERERAREGDAKRLSSREADIVGRVLTQHCLHHLLYLKRLSANSEVYLGK